MILGRRTRVVGEVALATAVTGFAGYCALNNMYPSAFTPSPQNRACIEQAAARLTGQTAEPTPANVAWVYYTPAFPILSASCRLKAHAAQPQPPQ